MNQYKIDLTQLGTNNVGPHEKEEECPTWTSHFGCACVVDTLKVIQQRNKELEEQIEELEKENNDLKWALEWGRVY